MKLLVKLINFWHYKRLKRTKLTRQQMRQQLVKVEGRIVRGIDYADQVALLLPRIMERGKQVNHQQRLRKLYYVFGLPGIKWYTKSMLRMVKYMKKASKHA
jgi:hypothetical protein